MSDSQEQSLDEDAVFLPVNDSSPEFLYCEKERRAVERLLSAGPEAFYNSISAERSCSFLSSEEVSQIARWAQDHHPKQVQVQREENGVEGSLEMGSFCSTYFPSQTDTAAPDLELGWPEKSSLVSAEGVKVHTSPSAEGDPPVREVIRRHLQKASQVIAIVTDRLTDGAVIGDLHSAASRGVPVYIILNQRSIKENLMLSRLRHPNIRVRVLEGRTFYSRTGKTVVGEMKEKFLLVDLETVIHGSYSLTWTDAHLHRQLITVLSGPVVDSFDREFRILFAASHPAPDIWRITGVHVDMTYQQKDLLELQVQKQLSLELDITNPPSPPANSLLDWEAMGVVQRECLPDSLFDQHEEDVANEMPVQNNMLLDNNIHIKDGFTHNGNPFLDKKRVYENSSPVINSVPHRLTVPNNIQTSPTGPATAERIKRMEHITEEDTSKQLSIKNNIHLDDTTTTTRLDDKAIEPTHNMVLLSSAARGQRSRSESILEEESSMDITSIKVDSISSRKPLILRMPQSESFSSLSDIMKRIQSQKTAAGLLKKGLNATVPEMSQSMVDLSTINTDINHDGREVPVPRSKCFEHGAMTPAFALMRKRNDGLRSTLHRSQKTFLLRERPRSYNYGLNMDWKKSMMEWEGEEE